MWWWWWSVWHMYRSHQHMWNVFGDWLRGVDSMAVQISLFVLRSTVAINTEVPPPCSPWQKMWLEEFVQLSWRLNSGGSSFFQKGVLKMRILTDLKSELSSSRHMRWRMAQQQVLRLEISVHDAQRLEHLHGWCYALSQITSPSQTFLQYFHRL